MSDARDLVFGQCQTCLRPICQCPAKRTPPPDAQAMTHKKLCEELFIMGHPETDAAHYEEAVRKVRKHDQAQRETIRRLEEKLSSSRQEVDRAVYDYCVMKEKKDDLQARLTASEAEHKDELRHYQASIMQLLRLVTPAPMESWKQSIIDKANHLIGIQGPLTPGEE